MRLHTRFKHPSLVTNAVIRLKGQFYHPREMRHKLIVFDVNSNWFHCEINGYLSAFQFVTT